MSEPQISALDVLNASAGCLQKQMYVYFTRPANGMAPVMENLEAHLKFQAELGGRASCSARAPSGRRTSSAGRGRA